MHRITSTLAMATAALLGMTTSAIAGELRLTKDGKTAYRIVVPADAPEATRWAGAELQHWLKEMSGADFPVVTDKDPLPEHAIVLGPGRHLDALGVEFEAAKPGPEVYLLRTVGNHLVIVGEGKRGTMYGVFGLLEEHLGCRWFAPGVQHIPKVETLDLPNLDEVKRPSFEYRSNYVKDCWDGPWTARNRLNGDSGSGHLTAEFGGGMKYGPGSRGHTSLRLVPPSAYFEEHPEYFCLRNGKRVPRDLCWSNHEALEIALDQIREDMRAHPEATVFSVSQMDGNDWACHCDQCTKISEREGSDMGPVLIFVNKVAEAIEDEFPQNAIITFAYRWTRVPTKTVQPRDNVILFLCDIECCFAHPMTECDMPANRAFVKQIEEWSRISKRLWIWNYETNFHHYMLPFPNYHTWAPNYRFFRDHHVTGLFTQDDYQNRNAELGAFGGYVRAKLLWDVDRDPEPAMREFLDGYYGPAARPMRAYMELLMGKVVDENIHMLIYDMYPWAYLPEDVMEKADRFFDEAEALVADQPEFLERVRIARLSLDYAIIEHLRRGATVDTSRVDEEQSLYYTDNPDLDRRIRRFLPLADKAGVTTLQEGYFDLTSRIADLVVKPEVPPNLATGKPATASEGTHPPHPAGRGNDGVIDINNYWDAAPWPQWWKVDLEDVYRVDRVRLHTYWWGHRTYRYTIEASVDGETWTQVVDMSKNTSPATIQGLEHSFQPLEARYLRVNMLRNSANIGVHIVEFMAFEAE